MIDYRFNSPITAQELARVFEASGINRPSKDTERLSRMLKGANAVVSAWADSKLVGVCRSITDYSYCCYLSDLAVDRHYQRRGIGTAMVADLRARLGEEVSVILIAAPEAVGYYTHLEFTRAEAAFVVKRSR